MVCSWGGGIGWVGCGVGVWVCSRVLRCTCNVGRVGNGQGLRQCPAGGGRLSIGLKLEEEQARGLTVALAQPLPPFRPQMLIGFTGP